MGGNPRHAADVLQFLRPPGEDEGAVVFSSAAPDPYAFLIGRRLDIGTLARARELAAEWGAPVHDVLIALGWVTPDDYAAALATSLDAPFVSATAAKAGGFVSAHVIDATGADPGQILRAVLEARRSGRPTALATRKTIEAIGGEALIRRRLEHARSALVAAYPHLSTATPPPAWQLWSLAALFGLFVGCAAVDVNLAIAAVSLLVAVPFLMIVGLRALALVLLATPARRQRPDAGHALIDAELPVYSVLVAMHDEADALPGLVAALSRLDYPPGKLDIILALEADDLETRAAVDQLDLPGTMRIVLVPPAEPRTKPKALNFALQVARGSFVVIYDAEDSPEPDQLRRALSAFRAGPTNLVCVQAQLNIHNWLDSWLSRQFAIEYTALFDALLPALSRLDLPLPLGGTSNHFRREALDRVLAWDPYNVTEDADLGLRLARLGGKVGVIRSTTWEEAPVTFGTWLRQRTRWLKGWMQTYAVHMRSPRSLAGEIGWRRFLAVQALLGGLVLSALAHPWFYVVTAYQVATGDPLSLPQTGTAAWYFWWVSAVNLGLGYITSMALAAVAVWRRRRLRLLPYVLTMPLYWLLISLAAYRAAWQLSRQPFLWEKTAHRAHPRGGGQQRGRTY
jgi:cellulose synthase/poly-beta-1,6-N-acetylglucosamine synthase-like glycosyltransferase